MRIYVFTLISFLTLTSLIFAGCAKFPRLKKEIVTEDIVYTVPKWKLIGILSEGTPTVIRVLIAYTGTVGAAITVIKSNYFKYEENFYNILSFGTSIYISEDGELLIIPKGGEAPDEVIIKRKLNPEYYSTKIKSSKTSSIIEENLKE